VTTLGATCKQLHLFNRPLLGQLLRDHETGQEIREVIRIQNDNKGLIRLDSDSSRSRQSDA